MHDFVAAEILRELREQTGLQRRILHELKKLTRSDDVMGGVMHQLNPSQGESNMLPIQPGNSPKFLVAPTFTGAPFTLDGALAAVSSSDPVNFPVALDPSDPQGTTIVADIPATASPTGGSEAIIVTWTYTNHDGVVATVTGSVTEVGIVDDVTGGTFSQIA